MKPTYYVRAAPHQPGLHYAFSAFGIQPARDELFDIAHVILVAEAVSRPDATAGQSGNDPQPAVVSQQGLALFSAIMQQEIALPVVRRLVEALRQTNTVLYREKQSVRIGVGLLIKDTLYLVGVGNIGAYLIRGNKVACLLHADRTRDRYLGHSAHLLLDYQIQLLPPEFFAQKPAPASLPRDHFVLEPSDTLILCSSELRLEQIAPVLPYVRQPERVAAHLAAATARHQAGQASAVAALHWRVDKAGQAVKQLGLVLIIFLCVTLAMQLGIQVNQRIARQMAVYAETGSTHQPPRWMDGPTPMAETTPVQARTLVTVHVKVNVDAALPSVVDTMAAGFVPTLVAVPTALALVQPLPPTPAEDIAPLPTSPSLPVVLPVTLPVTLPATPIPSPTSVPTLVLAAATVIPPLASAAVMENNIPLRDPVAAELPPANTAPVIPTVVLLEPPEQTSSEDSMTFAWQSDLALPLGQAYEVIIWEHAQNPLGEGLGIAPPTQDQRLTVQFKGLYAAGVMRPGDYQWGILLVTADPYTRIALLDGGRTFTFATASQSDPACNPDRETC